MSDTGCHICGDCWWVHCPNDADYTMDVELKRRDGKVWYDGKIELCGGHTRYVHETNGNHLSLNPLAIEQANALKKTKVTV